MALNKFVELERTIEKLLDLNVSYSHIVKCIRDVIVCSEEQAMEWIYDVEGDIAMRYRDEFLDMEDDAYALSSAGRGTDEDYGYYGSDEY